MRGLVSLCVRRFGAVTALAVLALILGVVGALHAPLDVFPEFVPSQVDIQTEAPGFTPLQVEELVTKRVESAVNGASGLATLRSGIDSRSVGGHRHLRRAHRSACGAPGHRRAADRTRQHPARRSRHAAAVAVGVEHHGPAEDRPAVGPRRRLRAARYGGLADQAPAAGRTRGGPRGRVRRQRAPDPDHARPRQALELRSHPRRRGRWRARRTRVARGRIHRPQVAARAVDAADALTGCRDARPRRHHDAQRSPRAPAGCRHSRRGAGTALRGRTDNGADAA